MKVLFFSLLAVSCLQLHGQPKNDSLWNIWSNESLDDTLRIDVMNDMAWNRYLFSKPDSAFICAQLAYDFSSQLGLQDKMAVALNTQGASYWVRGNFSKALLYFQKSYELFDAQNDLGNSATCLNNMGIIYRNQGSNLKALKYLLASLEIREELGDSSGMPNVLSNIGLIYQDQENYDQAMVYYQKSIEIRKSIDEENEIAGTLTNIGLILQIQENYKKALDYFEQGLAINQQNADRKGEANSLNNIGLLYKQQGENELALTYLEKSKNISEALGDNNGIANSLMSIGTIQIINRDYTNAIDNCDKAFSLAEELGDVIMQKESCNCLFYAFKAKGDDSKALEYHILLGDIEDKIQKNKVTENLQKMEFEREVAQDSAAYAEQAQLVQEKHEKELQREAYTRNILAGTGFVFLLLAGGFYNRWRFMKKSNAIIQQEKDRSENLLLNILPLEIAKELKEKGKAEARDFDMVSILFTDFIDFTQASEKLSAAELVEEVNTCFEAFDSILDKYKIEKIKTIGDAYMAAGGLPLPSKDFVKNTVLAAIEMQQFIHAHRAEKEEKGQSAFNMRAGIHTGPVVAGIVGVKKFQYDIWGDTVNTASRMESAGEAGKVNISNATYEILKDDSDFVFESRGKIIAKGKGEMEMWFVQHRE